MPGVRKIYYIYRVKILARKSAVGPKPERAGSSWRIRSWGDSGPAGDVVGRSARDPERTWADEAENSAFVSKNALSSDAYYAAARWWSFFTPPLARVRGTAVSAASAVSSPSVQILQAGCRIACGRRLAPVP